MDEKKKEVEAGDRVWVGGHKNPRARLQAVERTTKTQVILSGGFRYHRETHRLIGGDTLITGIATPEECAEWDARIQEEKRRNEARQAERERADALRCELYALFGKHVTIQRSYEVEGREWDVSLSLSEGGVRRLAVLIKDESL